MKLRLSAQQTEELLKLPESGMGYQYVDVVLKSGETLYSITVVNAEYLILSEKCAHLKSEDILELRTRK